MSQTSRMNTRGVDYRQRLNAKSDLTVKISKSPSPINSVSDITTPTVKKPKPKSSVYIQFPAKLTEDELMLQSKYLKLRKKKKALQKLRAPAAASQRTESELAMPIKRAKSPKMEARDAKEIAKKLVKSGTITIRKAPDPGSGGFKRPLGLERKLTTTEKSVGYQPFSATVMEGYGESSGKIFHKNRYESSSPVVAGVSGSAVVGGGKRTTTTNNNNNNNNNNSNTTNNNNNSNHNGNDKDTVNANIVVKDERSLNNNHEIDNKKQQSTEGQTLYVSGDNITEEFLYEVFGAYGKIVKLLVVHDKHYSFVTLKDEQATERALNELNNNTIKGIRLKVSFARRRMLFNNHRWAGLPGSEFQKYEDSRRDLVKYEDDIFDTTHSEELSRSIPDDN